ncbi:MAG: hypothetical protein V7K67_14875 [Nostoc sp.]|uniref:hypothetical protein n=1 Tax=Nostoc sp. TaxID=1180 RepID=UPI002FF9BE4F
MYRTSTGKLINADLNGAANILRKVETQLELVLVKVCRALLTVPTRFRIWETKAKKLDWDGFSRTRSNSLESPSQMNRMRGLPEQQSLPEDSDNDSPE